jgi:predicted enzyme related to lactoylglutathione lyase
MKQLFYPGPTSREEAVGANQAGIDWRGVCLDCFDAEEMAVFYGRLLGWAVTGRDTPADRRGGAGWVGMQDPKGGVGLSFQAEEWYRPPTWPEEKGHQAKMIHFEMSVDDLDAAVAEVIAAGGRIAPHRPADRDQAQHRIMLDPAGHPFCLYSG